MKTVWAFRKNSRQIQITVHLVSCENFQTSLFSWKTWNRTIIAETLKLHDFCANPEIAPLISQYKIFQKWLGFRVKPKMVRFQGFQMITSEP